MIRAKWSETPLGYENLPEEIHVILLLNIEKTILSLNVL